MFTWDIIIYIFSTRSRESVSSTKWVEKIVKYEAIPNVGGLIHFGSLWPGALEFVRYACIFIIDGLMEICYSSHVLFNQGGGKNIRMSMILINYLTYVWEEPVLQYTYIIHRLLDSWVLTDHTVHCTGTIWPYDYSITLMWCCNAATVNMLMSLTDWPRRIDA